MIIAQLFKHVALLLGLSMAVQLPAQADIEVLGPDGKRILLKENGTWRFVDAEGPGTTATAGTASSQDLAELQLRQRTDIPGGCSFALALHNQLPYEIRRLVPEFTAQRSNGVAYASQGLGFGPVKPGDTHRRILRFMGIACPDIARLRVGGGDRCDMGDLNKFSEPNGQCLARMRVLPSDVVIFDK